MNLLYIVEPQDVPPYRPNFTMPGFKSDPGVEVNPGDSRGAIAAGLGAAAAAGAAAGAVKIVAGALGGPLLGLPASLLISAAASSPAVARIFTKDKEQLPKELDSQEQEAIGAFMRRHAYSIQMAKDAGFKFPPGHPQVGQVYKQHPLADVPAAGKADIYIPSDKYDELLLQEREAELLKLLVHLGATKVVISKKHNASSSRKMDGSVTGGSKNIGEAEIGASFAARTGTVDLDTREFELDGREWKEGDKLDVTRFAWVHFEPSWNALIDAREIGGCTRAALEVRENTAFSSDRGLAIKVKSKLYGAAVSTNAATEMEEEKAFLVKAEFGKIKRSPDS
ncbi:hypothetical protein [Burkholderia gladioli]|uniref:hypothetical protein n=1 Tax=Burkholderia gladioli TaxID=28095 RepID=UPI0016402B51|nr:hypothetical protein [Burkholderia gladioli]